MKQKIRKHQFPTLPDFGVIIESHHHGPRFRTAMHAHDYYSVLFIVAGAGQCRTEQSEYDLGPDSVIVLDKGQAHQLIDYPRSPMTVFVVYFSDTVAQEYLNIWQVLVQMTTCYTIPAHSAQMVRNLMRRMLYEQSYQPERYDLALQQGVGELLLRLYRQRDIQKHLLIDSRKPRSEARVKQVLNYVHGHYYQPQSLVHAAKSAQLSQRQFGTICRRLTGRSFVHFVNQLRIDKACEFLQQTDKPVSAVAFEVGFEDLSTFYRAFKKITHGRSPLSYRQ